MDTPAYAAHCPTCGQALGALAMTPRERQVLALLAHGLTCKEIARNLGIARKTAENLISSLYDHLGARNAPHAVMLGLEAGYLVPTCGREG